MNYIKQIMEYIPQNEQESEDKKVILDYIEQFPDSILLRDNKFAHMTSSGFIMNKQLDKVLMVHHNIYNTWAWTGGHADGDADLLYVAIKEAKEETGVNNVIPLSKDIASIDMFAIKGHTRKGKYVSPHVHLSAAYILIADEEEKLIINKKENSGVKWFALDSFTEDNFEKYEVYLYTKMIQKAKKLGNNKIL